jgi:hypothetical protein
MCESFDAILACGLLDKHRFFAQTRRRGSRSSTSSRAAIIYIAASSRWTIDRGVSELETAE